MKLMLETGIVVTMCHGTVVGLLAQWNLSSGTTSISTVVAA